MLVVQLQVLSDCGSWSGGGGQVVKQEWPARWPNFIKELVGSSKPKVNPTLCANNMNILLLLRSLGSGRSLSARTTGCGG